MFVALPPPLEKCNVDSSYHSVNECWSLDVRILSYLCSEVYHVDLGVHCCETMFCFHPVGGRLGNKNNPNSPHRCGY